MRRTLAAATWRALHKALFPHQWTELRKGKIPQRLSHLEWFGVAIQLPGSQSLSELLGLKTDQSKRPLRKTKSTHKQQTDQNGMQTRPTGQQTHAHTHTHPHRARAGDKEREREKQSWRGTRTNRDADTKKTRRQFGPKEGQEGAYIISKDNEKENVNMTGDES